MAITLIKPEIDIWEPGSITVPSGAIISDSLRSAELLKTKDFQLDIGIRENRIRQSLEGVVKDYPQLGGEIAAEA